MYRCTITNCIDDSVGTSENFAEIVASREFGYKASGKRHFGSAFDVGDQTVNPPLRCNWAVCGNVVANLSEIGLGPVRPEDVIRPPILLIRIYSCRSIPLKDCSGLESDCFFLWRTVDSVISALRLWGGRFVVHIRSAPGLGLP